MTDAEKFVMNKDGYAVKWDRDEDRVYEVGDDMGVLYIKGDNTTTDTAYGKAIAWNGLSSVSENSEGGEPNDIYADDIKYLSIPGNEDSGFSVEAYTYPEEFGVCDGSEELAGVYISQQRRKKFGFVFRSKIGDNTDDNIGYKFHIYYNCQAAPSERSYSTINDSPEAITMSWDVSTTPDDIGTITDDQNVAHVFKPSAHITIDTRKFTTTEAQTRLNSVLNVLFGTPASGNAEAVEGKLPPIDTIIKMLGGWT